MDSAALFLTSISRGIDIHHHFVPPFFVVALARAGHPVAAMASALTWSPEKSLAMMDTVGIETAIVSLSLPGVSFAGATESAALARRCNDYAAGMIADYPGRFGAFASLPVLDTQAALEEIDYALDTLKLDGVMLLTNVCGRYLGDEEFDPLLAELNRRKAIVFLHPNQSPRPGFNDFVEFPHEVARALASLTESGAIERYHRIRYILAYGGGTIPFIASRVTVVGMDVFGNFLMTMIRYFQRVRTMQRMNYDLCASTDPYAWRALSGHTKLAHILMGSNFPWTSPTTFARQQAELRTFEELDPLSIESIERRNSLKLFPRFSASPGDGRVLQRPFVLDREAMNHEGSTVQSFDELDWSGDTAAGGKAATLARLHQAGYPVPDGFVVLPGAFAEDDLKPSAWRQIQTQMRRLCMDADAVAFAVRSSASSEDSAQASFAGEFETVLGVRDDDEICEDIQKVRRSRRSKRVETYSRVQGIDASHEIAVVVQRMVRSELSGVIFTADPVSGKRSSMSGNYLHGLGEGLVSGEVTGERFTIQRPSGAYRGPSELRRCASRLYKLAVSLEQELGGPQDIEWAVANGKLYLLQSRPITTLRGHNPTKGEWNDSLIGDFLWSNVNVGEAYMQVMTPFTWSMLQNAFSDMSLLPGYDLLGNIGGRPYFNVSITASVMRAMGRDVRDMVNEFAGGYDRLPNGMDLLEIPMSRWAFLPLLQRAIYMQWKQWQALRRKDRFLAENPDWCQRMMARSRETRTGEELLALWYGEIADYGMKYFWLLGATAYDYGELAGRLRRDLIGLVGREEVDTLLSNVSSETEFLASLGPVVGLWQLFRGEITREEFLIRYGHRGPNEGEYLIPRPAEDPQWLDRQLEAFARSPVDVEALLAKQRARFEAAWARFQKCYPDKVKSVGRRLERAAAAARLRENVRSEMMRLIWVSRICALRAGELTGLGEDVFFLYVDELEDVLRGRSTAAIQYVQERRRTYERYSALPQYPPIILGQFDPLEWAADPDRRNDVFDSHAAPRISHWDNLGSKSLIGSPGSAGLVEGIVRRLDSLEEGDKLRAGEILVTAQTNIGWTLLFPRATAIVTDVGAPLSHAAIVARELGIPAVVGCGDATMRLKTGDRVRVDGAKGIVEMLETAPQHKEASLER